jgi:hypothetical protein
MAKVSAAWIGTAMILAEVDDKTISLLLNQRVSIESEREAHCDLSSKFLGENSPLFLTALSSLLSAL